MNATVKSDIHEKITSQIITALESASGNFELPWKSLSRPINVATGNAYHGVNVMALWAAAMMKGFGDGVWGTYRQWQKVGAQVRKGEKSSLIVFYKEINVESESGETDELEKRHFARVSWVFNAAQVEGWTPETKPVTDPIQALENVEIFIKATKADIRHGGSKAFYSPTGDFIQMPCKESFTGTKTSSVMESWYGTLLHELTHWTGNKQRCDRDFSGRFGDDSYAMEELVAELGSAFLCADLQITPSPRQDHAEYIAHWLDVLKKDKKAIFTASSKADQAVAWIHACYREDKAI